MKTYGTELRDDEKACNQRGRRNSTAHGGYQYVKT